MSDQNVSSEKQIIAALQYLSGVCDGAIKRDNVGFNGTDSFFGKSLAFQSTYSKLSQKQLSQGLKMLRKYHKQLSLAGFELPEVAPEVASSSAAPAPVKSKLELVSNLLVVTFASKPEESVRSAMKQIRGFRYDPESHAWTFPASKENVEALTSGIPGIEIDRSIESLNAARSAEHTKAAPAPVAPRPVQSEVSLDLEDGEIIVKFASFAVFQKIGDKVKALPERKYDPKRDGRPWVVPARLLLDVMKAYPNAALSEEVQKLAKQQQELVSLSRKASSDFEVPTKLDLLPYQKAAVHFLEVSNGRGILGDVMGLGKTAEIIGYLQLHPEDRPAVFVVPSSLKINTKREIEKFIATEEKIEILSGQKPTDLRNHVEILHTSIFILNYDILSYWVDALIALQPKIVIFDEAHFLKEQRAKPKDEKKERKGSQRGNAALDLAETVSKVVCMTGTPIVNRPKEFFPLLHMIDPKAWDNNYRFMMQYCDPKPVISHGKILVRNGKTVMTYNGASNLDDLFERTKAYMIRRSKDQVLKELPEKRHATVVVEYDHSFDEEYQAVVSGAKQVIENSSASKIPDTVLAEIERAKQATASAKLSSSIDWIRNFIEANGKLIVFTNHHFVADRLMKEFPSVAVKHNGEMNPEEKQASVDAFQTNENVRLFVGNLKASGVGITLTAASSVAFLEFPWTPGDLQQCADRVHRIGQKNAVTVYYIAAENTIDEDIADLLQSKANVLGQAQDGKEQNLSIFEELCDRIRSKGEK